MLSATQDTPADATNICELCERETHAITRHHLYPRVTQRRARKTTTATTQQNKDATVWLCWPCHCAIHHIIPGEVMTSEFHSLNTLKTHPGVATWLAWASERSFVAMHGLMIPCRPRKTREPVSAAVERVFETIWIQNGREFPRLTERKKGQEKRPRALLHAAKKLAGPSVVLDRAQVRSALQARPEYRLWYRWVFA